MEVEEKLKFFKPGLEVLYYGIIAPNYRSIPERVILRNEPWQLGSGTWVVSVVGRAGGLSLDHLECAHSVGSVENNIAKCSDCGREAKIV